MVKIDPTQLKFQLQKADRRFCSTKRLLGRVNSQCYSDRLYQRDHKEAGVTVSGGETVTFAREGQQGAADTQESIQESRIFVSGVAPFYQIDFAVLQHSGGEIQAVLSYPDMEIVIALQKTATSDSKVTIQINKEQQVQQRIEVGELGVLPSPYQVCMLVSGADKLALFVSTGGKIVNTFQVALAGVDFYQKAYLETQAGQVWIGAALPAGAVCELGEIAVSQSCGVGQADPRILHDQAGRPIIEKGRVFVAMTTRGIEDIQAIYSFDLDGGDWRLEGQLLFDLGGDTYHNFTAADIMFNEADQHWYVFPVSHNRDHQLYIGKTTQDIRYGVSILDIQQLDYPKSGNDEDFYCFFDRQENKWRAPYCKATSKGYQLHLLEAAEIAGPWQTVTKTSITSFTGPIIQKIGEETYIFTGRGIDTFEILSYPALEKIGELTYNGKTESINIWPVIFPLPMGNKACYAMLTFDRIAPLGGWSYGGSYFYKSQLFDTSRWADDGLFREQKTALNQ